MPPTTIHEAPQLESFTPLEEHQSQTPASFFPDKPVLYFHNEAVRIIPPPERGALPIFAADADAHIQTYSLFVGSQNLILFNASLQKGVSIPYPSISLHATQTLQDPTDETKQVSGLYMQLELTDDAYTEEPEIIELTLIPPDDIQKLYDAVSACSDLHPDATAGDEDDDRIVFEGNVGYEGFQGLPPPMPGSGGWITAENVNEFFDSDGNFIGETLGDGAGHTRGRDDVNGHDEEESEESKRPRVE